ncbi:MAG: transcriptional regulator with XRE-family HTH domain [Paraglaciecola sp.]
MLVLNEEDCSNRAILFYLIVLTYIYWMINDRIAFVISALNMNPNSFADNIGVSSTVIYNIIKGRRNKPSYDLLTKILNYYTAIDTNWLLRGGGTFWFKEEVIEVKPQVLAEKIEVLIERINLAEDESIAAVELAELSEVMLRDYRNATAIVIKLENQNQQIFNLLREKLGLRI